MTNRQRRTFHYIGMQDEKDFKVSRFVLDTNVVSKLSSLCKKKEYDSNDLGSVKAVALLHELAKFGNPEVSGVLATIECSGFHSGELSLQGIRRLCFGDCFNITASRGVG